MSIFLTIFLIIFGAIIAGIGLGTCAAAVTTAKHEDFGPPLLMVGGSVFALGVFIVLKAAGGVA